MNRFVFTLSVLFITACSTAHDASAPIEQPGAYMIVSGKNYDPKALGPYAASLPPIYEKYGGHYVAFAPKYDTMEGNPDAQAVIISAWPDVAAAKAFWTSPEYRDAIKLREGIGEFEVIVLPALPPQK